MQTGITCKKIPCYMCDSACRWRIVKKLSRFQVMLSIFKFSRVLKLQSFDWSLQLSFHHIF